METPEKVRENRLRRGVQRRGYIFAKSRLRDPMAVGYGRIRVETDDGREAAGFGSADGLGLTLDELEDRLGGKGWGVYRLRASDQTLLYVGSSDDPAARWGVLSMNAWWADVRYREVAWYATEEDARAMEAQAVVTELPLHNVRLRSSDLTKVVAVRMTPQEMADLDAARGQVSRAEWLRRILLGAEPRLSGKYWTATLPRVAAAGCNLGDAVAALAAAGHQQPPADPLGIKIITDERMPPGTAALVSRGRDGVSVSAFSLGASEPEPERAPKNCKHPRVHGKGVCPDCHEWVASKR